LCLQDLDNIEINCTSPKRYSLAVNEVDVRKRVKDSPNGTWILCSVVVNAQKTRKLSAPPFFKKHLN
jgi:hypothetical protein